jgi:hypothetical protein
MRHGQRPGEVGEEDRARLERRDEQRLEACVAPGELGAQLRDAAADLDPREVDLPDRVARGREALG